MTNDKKRDDERQDESGDGGDGKDQWTWCAWTM